TQRCDPRRGPYALKQGHLVIHSMTPQMRFGVVLPVGLLVISFAGCAKKAPEPTRNPAMQEIKVIVKSEYSPDRIVVKKGRPVRLLFHRDDDSECTAQVVIPDLNVKQGLALENVHM